MKGLLFSAKASALSSLSFHYSSTPPRLGFSSCRPTYYESVMDKTLEMAEPMIMKWNPESNTSEHDSSLFHELGRKVAKDFIKIVNNLQRDMRFLINENSSSEKLIRAQILMQIAMNRLQKDFYQILSGNRACLDPESVSTRSSSRASIGSGSSNHEEHDLHEHDHDANELSFSEYEDVSTVVMEDLRLIAECMISSGHADDCLKIYKIIRQSMVDEAIYRLGVEKFTSSQIHKMGWESVDLRIKNWLHAVRHAVNTLFSGEKILCDHVFAVSDSIRESCFADITKKGAMILFQFPENVVNNGKRSPEKDFRTLDMYTALSNHWPGIESIFSSASTSDIKSQAVKSQIKLGEYVRSSFNDYVSTVSKGSFRSPVSGGGIHRLTSEVMNYLSILSDYCNVLVDIFADSPQPTKDSPQESCFEIFGTDETPAPVISFRIAKLILILLCKLDVKARQFKDSSLACTFLGNNLRCIARRVRTSNLKFLLGDEWLRRHDAKVKQFESNYECLDENKEPILRKK